jgi:hypothetical protein
MNIHSPQLRTFTLCNLFLQDISFVLEDYMEVNFNTILEDGSTDELGDLLVWAVFRSDRKQLAM